MFKNALVSVSDKTGLIEFLKPHYEKGLRLVSTGGTAAFLRTNGMKVTDVSEQTQFPEVMGGRVKTLHPMIHMALLSRAENNEDTEVLLKNGIEPFDLLVCNLYPFENAVLKKLPPDEVIENIDIGGPSLLRASAKNFERLTVVCDPADYANLNEKIFSIPELQREEGLVMRRQLAAKVFTHVAAYDSLIGQTLTQMDSAAVIQPGEGKWTIAGQKVIDLRYGENPEQASGWYRNLADDSGLHSATIIQGKALSYNNILDLDAAVSLVKELDQFAVVAVKHNNPCGVAENENSLSALQMAIQSDPVSVFGGIIAFNHKLSAEQAELLNTIFLECIVAPDFSADALLTLAKKKNVRVLKWEKMLQTKKKIEMKSICGGFLVQSIGSYFSESSKWKFLNEKPSAEMLKDLIFAEKVCASLKSNSISIVNKRQTLGLGMGQVNRVDAVTHAIHRWKTNHKSVSSSVLASDAFFPFPDSIEKAAEAGVKWILQPGGSVKDEEVFAVARSLNVNMVITGQRHFRH